MSNPSRQPNSNWIEVRATLKSRGEERTDFESHNTENSQNMAAIVNKNRQDANLTTQTNLHETVSDHNNENNKESQQIDMSNDEDNLMTILKNNGQIIYQNTIQRTNLM